ncbi:class I SAM-dependent methyltransferase [Parvibium lacunae]|uniref:Class I SAM-dependent methyltransferase n=1 Tax=Parvibium lacunae TaxID=1888893 RepID=A0A368L8I0_9BURK|nr:class I SAM-dependent methyltransferase [Parvibium lacunae]RCS59862.1 class I SAM-dependent methyltransferase [Parvibium lacunae]
MDSAEAYELNALTFLEGRDQSEIGSKIVEKWAHSLEKKASVIELACGGGYPITRTLAETAMQLWAIDSSPTLVAKFKSRFPNIPIQCEKVQNSTFFGRKFDAAIAVGLLFLLPATEQADLITRIAETLLPKGRFLFMAPIQTGTWKDLNTGLECISLGQEGYGELLHKAGFRVIATYMDKGENNYYDAELISEITKA